MTDLQVAQSEQHIGYRRRFANSSGRRQPSGRVPYCALPSEVLTC